MINTFLSHYNVFRGKKLSPFLLSVQAVVPLKLAVDKKAGMK